MNLHFFALLGRQNTEIKFNADGDAYGFYNIYQYQRKEEGRFDYTLIGQWKEKWVVAFDSNRIRRLCHLSCGLHKLSH